MSHYQRLEGALQSPDRVRALRELVLELSKEGLAKAEVYELLETYLTRLRAEAGDHNSDEDALLAVMDALSDWCHPKARLLSDEPFAG